MHATKLTSSGGEPSNIKRGKKPIDKNSLQQQQSQLVRQKSSFKVTDSPTAGLLSQQSVTSPDDSQSELKPLKVVIKRVGDGGNSSNDESQQQQAIKQRKKQQTTNPSGLLPGTMRKLSNNTSSGGSSPSVLIKSESIDMSQSNSDPNTMMPINDGMQQTQR
jgi:alkaline phosphatase